VGAVLALGVIAVPVSARCGAVPIGLTPDQQAVIDKLAKSTHSENVEYAKAPTDIGAEVTLPFRTGKDITLVRTGSIIRDDGSIAWRGEVKETGEQALLMLWGNALLTGYFAYNGTIYAVESLGGGINTFEELGRVQQLADHPPTATPRDSIPITNSGSSVAPARPRPVEPEVKALPDADRKALEAKKITIDIMLLYTKGVARHYVHEPDDLLALAIEETNHTFRNSGLGNISLRLVHTELVEYDASHQDQFTHLYAMVDGLGPFKDVKKLRDEKRADIVGLIIDNPRGCGLSTRVGPDSQEAFFVVHHACGTISMSIAHEIGHILGIRHDRTVDERNEPFAYGHGYVNDSKWRDIMSYKEGCGGCPRIPYWSNPRIMYKGEPTGTPAADSARVILEQAERISKFR
jgi:hypothetical protein